MVSPQATSHISPHSAEPVHSVDLKRKHIKYRSAEAFSGAVLLQATEMYHDGVTPGIDSKHRRHSLSEKVRGL